MAKLSVEVDTKEGTWTITLNGKKVENVREVSCYYSEYDDKVGVRISTYEEDDDKDVRTMTYISASEKADLVSEGKAVKSKEYPSFVKLIGNDLRSDIRKFLQNRNGHLIWGPSLDE